MPTNRTFLLPAAGLFLLAGALHEAEDLLPPELNSACFLAVTLLYLGLTLGWAASIAQRIMHRTVRRLLIACAALAALWIVLRTCKYRFFDSEAVCLMLWYFYYLPQLFAPVLMLLAALHLGRREEEAISPRWYLLLVPAAALFLGIATNNRHELAFRFFPPQSRPDVYAHGPLYFAALAFMLVTMAAGVGMVFARSRVPSGRRFIWLPGAVFLSGLALCLLSFANVLTAFKVPEMFCATFIATWECCMQVGLLPSNTNYGGFFSASTICAQLDDAQGNVVLRSAQQLTLTEAQRQQARSGALMLTPDLRLSAHAICGGAILYTESIAGINRIRGQLRETAGLLAEENELVRAENEAAAQQAHIEEQNRLYEGMLGAVRPQLARMEALLDGMTAQMPDFSRRMTQLCVYGAYVKRRCNLSLIAEAEPRMQAQELALCIRESLCCLTDAGVCCALRTQGESQLLPQAVTLAYDFFEAAVEAALPGLSALLVNLHADGTGLTLRLALEDAQPLDARWAAARREALGATLAIERQDGTLYETLYVPHAEGTGERV